jgi:hypothetical protein
MAGHRPSFESSCPTACSLRIPSSSSATPTRSLSRPPRALSRAERETRRRRDPRAAATNAIRAQSPTRRRWWRGYLHAATQGLSSRAPRQRVHRAPRSGHGCWRPPFSRSLSGRLLTQVRACHLRSAVKARHSRPWEAMTIRTWHRGRCRGRPRRCRGGNRA